jgi:hypothetical protein
MSKIQLQYSIHKNQCVLLSVSLFLCWHYVTIRSPVTGDVDLCGVKWCPLERRAFRIPSFLQNIMSFLKQTNK